MGVTLVYTNDSNGSEIYTIETDVEPVRSQVKTEQETEIFDKIIPLKCHFDNGKISEKEYVDKLIKLIDEIE
jgi:hypothetical protein